MRNRWGSLSLALLSAALTVAAFPAAAAQCGPLKIITSLDLQEVPSGRPTTAVSIGNTPRKLLVDTGGVVSMLTRRTIEELNLTPTRTNMRFTGVTGAYSDEVVRLPAMTIGALQIQEGAYFVVSPFESNEFDGMLAPEFLQKFDADFDFAARKLNLISPDHCDGSVVYWKAPAVAVVSMRLDRGGHITFPMMLDGKRVDAMLDTGATPTVLKLDVAHRVFRINVDAPDVEKIGELEGNYTAATYRKRFQTLAVGGVTVTNPTIVLIPDMTNSTPRSGNTGSLIREAPGIAPLILGMSVLSKLHVYIAYKERKLYITAADAVPEP